ncbi:YggT family protein [Garciella nitratireducens]|uniref:YggT family protein n=1 Tax=Garciella nitratireducens DSM 15102 TaxID=1121911 RepID=A0A1T4JZP4_9FIRM|nr:YggT family protein [Garciella nitratireducens]RBP39190.1 YggT family protein [Garciella nitratireducens]SJZ35641.1 YggT family protein [Garciella nitratireducens DSM 15102]
MSSIQTTLLTAGYYLFELIYFLIFIRVILSWIRLNSSNKFIMMIYNLTEPILEPFRKLLDRFNIGGGMIDFSPIVAIFIIQLIIHPLYNKIISFIF